MIHFFYNDDFFIFLFSYLPSNAMTVTQPISSYFITSNTIPSFLLQHSIMLITFRPIHIQFPPSKFFYPAYVILYILQRGSIREIIQKLLDI